MTSSSSSFTTTTVGTRPQTSLLDGGHGQTGMTYLSQNSPATLVRSRTRLLAIKSLYSLSNDLSAACAGQKVPYQLGKYGSHESTCAPYGTCDDMLRGVSVEKAV